MAADSKSSESPPPEIRFSEIIIVGAGFAGIGMGIQLRRKGISKSFQILERAPKLGGTWRENTYPGAACDVTSHVYSYSFELNPDWSYMFARQAEIWDYLERCTDKYKLREQIQFNTFVIRAAYDEEKCLWKLYTKEGLEYQCKILISGTGPLNKMKLPDIPGRESFAGPAFHTAAWDHEADLKGKKVAVIGTGASAIQVVPGIAGEVGELKLFQRTPAWVIPRPDRKIGKFAKGLYRKLPFVQRLHRTFLYWKNEIGAYAFTRKPKMMKVASRLPLRNLRKAIKDPELQAKLTPDYIMGCKRVLLSNDYYPAIAQDHVHLITEGIQEINSQGLVTKDGVLHEVDVIVYATGFQAAENMAPFEFRGRAGINLQDEWEQGGEAYLGTTVAGFPNFFIIIGPNTGLGHNSMLHVMESQYTYILGALKAMEKAHAKSVEVRKEVQDAFNEEIQAKMGKTVWMTGGCSSWYINGNGKNTTLWPGFTIGFRRRTRKFRIGDYRVD